MKKNIFLIICVIDDCQNRLQAAMSAEKVLKEDNIILKTKFDSMETQFSATLHDVEVLKLELVQQKTERTLMEQNMKR